MALMDYFRRPVLAGKTLTRQSRAVVRGDIRRTDIDGFSAVPYFPGVSAAETLQISIDGGAAVTATMTGTPPGGIANVIADINTALGASGLAFDADGTIGIQSTTIGGISSVEVVGGTAAADLGFDLTKNTFKSATGEIQATPEARRGNPFGTGFPSRGENFTAESMQRALARISSNADVLFSEAVRNDVVVRQVAFTNVDGTRLQITTAADELFTGLGLLSNASTKEDLVPYFYLVDTVTKQPAKSRVVAVVRGAPGGGPPFANATTWSGGGSAGNILGVSLEKISAAVIDSITGGRVVECPAANFSDVQPGDFATIATATNLTPFSNNGQRWVVEEVLSTTTVALRPMSKSELTQVGFTATDVQPVVELNDNLQALESYGTLTIKTGTYCSGIGAGISVVVSPPIPTGATYQLFAAQPLSNRVKTVYDDQRSSGAPFWEFVTDLDPVANWTLSGAVATLGGGNCNITAANIVWHGRVYNLPAQTLLPADFADGSNYVYWDEATGNYAIAATTAGFYQVLDPASGTKGHAIAFVTKSGGGLTSVSPMTRLRGEKAIPVTVGTGGQFPDLIQATLWARALETTYAEGSTSTGAYPHFEFILLNDTTTNNLNPVLPNPGCIVRGINPNVQLNLGTGFFNVFGKVAEFRDFKLVATGAKAIGIGVAVDRISIDNVQHIASDGNSLTEIIGTSGNSMKDLWMRDSTFRIKQGISSAFTASLGVANCIVKNCKFTYDPTGAVVPHIFQKNDATPDWDGNFLVVEDSEFLNSFGGVTADGAAILVANNVATSTMFFRNVKFSLGGFTSANNNVLINLANNATLYMDSFEMTSGSIQRVVAGNSANAKCYNSIIRCCPASSVAALTGHTFANCNLTHTDTVAGGSGFGIDPVTMGFVTDCTLSGPFNTSIRVNAADIIVRHNRIDLSKPGTGIPTTGIIVNPGAIGSVIDGNIVVWATSASVLTTGLNGISSGADRITICNNKVYVPAPTAASVSAVGIQNSGLGCVTANNYVATVGTGVAAATQTVTGLSLGGNDHTIVGNVVLLVGTTTQDFRGVHISSQTGSFSGNVIESYGRTIVWSSTREDMVVSDNQFISTTLNSISSGAHAQNMGGMVTGNRFSSATNNPVTVGWGNYSNNKFVGPVLMDTGIGGSGLVNFVFSNNYVEGSFDGVTNSPFWARAEFCSNHITNDFSLSFSSTLNPIPELIFTGNLVRDTTSITTTTAIAATVTSNLSDEFTVTLSPNGAFGDPVNAPSILNFSDNRTITGFADLEAEHVTCHGNMIAGALTVQNDTLPAHASRFEIIGNEVGTDLTVDGQYVRVSNNWIGDDVLLTRPTGLGIIPGPCSFTHNYVGGDFDADQLDSGAYVFSELTVQGNLFDATTISTWGAKASFCYISENHITPTNGLTVTVGGSQIHFNDNTVFATAFTTGSNQTTKVEFTHSSALGKAWVDNNYIYGRVELGFGSGTGFSDLWFTRNWVYSLWDDEVVQIGGIATNGGCVISENDITCDQTAIATDAANGCILFHGANNTDNVRIQGNFLRLIGLSATYTAARTWSVLDAGGAANTHWIINGNIIEKPANTTISTFLQTINYIRIAGASAIVVNVNLMAAGGTVGAAPERQGGLAYHAGAGTYTLAE